MLFFCLGNVLRKLGDTVGADEQYESGLTICDQAAENDPKRRDVAKAFKGRLLYAMGRKEEVREIAEQMGRDFYETGLGFENESYLPNTEERLARLTEIVGGRDIALLAHGPSIGELERRIGEITDRDVCYVGVNRFSVLETGILSQIGRTAEVVCPTNSTEFQAQGDKIIDFLERTDSNMVISPRYALAGLTHALPNGESFCDYFDPKLLLLAHRHIIQQSQQILCILFQATLHQF